MRDLKECEALRSELNQIIDAGKNDRNAHGQFATPNELAKAIVRETVALLEGFEKPDVLEPACGSGSFISAVLSAVPNAQVFGVERDSDYFDAAKKCFGHNTKLLCTDYLSWESCQKFDLIITNPPYVRHHLIDRNLKNSFRNTCKVKGIAFSGLSDLYCYFLIKAMDDLRDGGIACWLIPEEFLSVKYGIAVKNHLLNSYSIPRIHCFASEDTKFEDALVSSCVVWVKKEKSEIDAPTRFTFGPDIEHPMACRFSTKSELLARNKWGVQQNERGEMQFKELFRIKRGIATGANDFFILDRKKAAELGLPTLFLTPILPSARYVKVNRITGDQDRNPTNIDFQYLLDCSENEIDVMNNYPHLWAYLQTGMHLKDESYICKHRKVWYWQDKRNPPLFFLTYMGRGGKDTAPFRFILNESNAIANNSFLLLYPTDVLAQKLEAGELTVDTLLQSLNSIAPEVLVSGGRQYGGGLKKIEPKELGEIYINL